MQRGRPCLRTRPFFFGSANVANREFGDRFENRIHLTGRFGDLELRVRHGRPDSFQLVREIFSQMATAPKKQRDDTDPVRACANKSLRGIHEIRLEVVEKRERHR